MNVNETDKCKIIMPEEVNQRISEGLKINRKNVLRKSVLIKKKERKG